MATRFRSPLAVLIVAAACAGLRADVIVEAVAVRTVQHLGGTLTRDHAADGRPVRSVDLSGCFQTADADLKELTALAHLRTLSLAGCRQITDAGLKELSALPELRALDLTDCTGVTDAGVADLKKARPGLRVER